MSPLLPPRPIGKKRGSTIYLVESVWNELDQLAAANGYQRNDVIEQFLSWAIADYYREKGLQPGGAEAPKESAPPKESPPPKKHPKK